jgi:hypothetical protein
MNATTDARKLNFMTDQGSSRASVSIACRLAGLRPLIVGFCFCCFCLALFEPRFCQAEETELARPAAAPVTAEVAAEVAAEAAEVAAAKPPVAVPDDGAEPDDEAGGADGADGAVVVASRLACHADPWWPDDDDELAAGAQDVPE